MLVNCEVLGTSFALPANGPRVVSLLSAATETLFALGQGSQVVGVSSYCHRYVPGLSAPVVGDYLRADRDLIRQLDPDLVLLTGGIQLALGRQLAAAGLPVYALPLPASRYGIWENTLTLGAFMGRLPAARALCAQQAVVCQQLETAALQRRPRVYAEMWFGRFPRVAGGRSFVHDLIELAGGHNVFGDDPGSYLPLDLAAIAAREPEVLLLFSEPEYPVDGAQLLAQRGWKLPAVNSSIQRGQNIIQDGPSFCETAQWLATQLCNLPAEPVSVTP